MFTVRVNPKPRSNGENPSQGESWGERSDAVMVGLTLNMPRT